MPINLLESDFTSDSTWPPAEAKCPMCVCLFSNVQTCIVWVLNSIGQDLKFDFQLYLGWPFWLWKQIWQKIQNGRQACPMGQIFSPALILGPNSLEINLRCHFQLSLLWPFCLWNQIWPQIQDDCGPLCLMFKHAQVRYLSHRVEKQLRCHFQQSFGCSFSWWNLVWP